MAKTETRNIGIALEDSKQQCSDINCPFHGKLSVRGRQFTGTIVSTKMRKTAVIEFNLSNSITAVFLILVDTIVPVNCLPLTLNLPWKGQLISLHCCFESSKAIPMFLVSVFAILLFLIFLYCRAYRLVIMIFNLQ